MRTTIIMLVASKTWYNHNNDSGIYGSEDMSRVANRIPKTVVATPRTIKVTVMLEIVVSAYLSSAFITRMQGWSTSPGRDSNLSDYRRF